MSNAANPANSKKSPYKPTDFRHKLWIHERKTLRSKAKQRSFRVDYDESMPKSKNLPITVDTSKARSNIDVLRLCLKELNWREYHFGRRSVKCDIHWNSVTFSNDDSEMPKSGKINKFPGMGDVLLKVNLGRVLDVMQRLYPHHYDFHPRQWFLPQQMSELIEEARQNREAHKPVIYIVKPDDGSQGDGIQLLSDPSQLYLEDRKKYIAQEYISRPLLLDKLKFDLRVYAVLTSLDPLEVHICREGLARFCTEPYAPPTPSNLSQTYMHLTNYSLNKWSSGYEHTSSGDDGSKRTLSGVLQRLARMGHDVHAIQQRIELLVVKTFIAIAPDLKVYHRVELPSSHTQLSCFQIVGFDILLKQDGCPVLLEVNSKPSLRIDYEAEVAPGICQSFYSYVDEKIKKALLVDTLLLVAPTHRKSSKKTDEPCEVSKHKGYDTLIQLLPSKYGKQFDDLCLLQKIADIFVDSLGIRGHVRMGATAFRMFASRCCFPDDQKSQSSFGFTNAAFDIMFIDLQRRWEHMNTGISNGLCLQAFVEAFLQLAQKVSPNNSLLEATKSMVEQYRPAQVGRRPKTIHLPRIREPCGSRMALKQDKTASISRSSIAKVGNTDE